MANGDYASEMGGSFADWNPAPVGTGYADQVPTGGDTSNLGPAGGPFLAPAAAPTQPYDFGQAQDFMGGDPTAAAGYGGGGYAGPSPADVLPFLPTAQQLFFPPRASSQTVDGSFVDPGSGVMTMANGNVDPNAVSLVPAKMFSSSGDLTRYGVYAVLSVIRYFGPAAVQLLANLGIGPQLIIRAFGKKATRRRGGGISASQLRTTRRTIRKVKSMYHLLNSTFGSSRTHAPRAGQGRRFVVLQGARKAAK